MRWSLLFFILFAFSAAAELFRGPVSGAIGGGGRAGLNGLDGVFTNPAVISLLKTNELAAYYRDGYVDVGQHRQAIGLGAADNSPDVLFPGSLNYLRLRETGPAGAVDGELWHGAIAQINDPVALGVSGFRLASAVAGDKEYVQWNFSVGALWMISPDFGVAYVLDNLAKPGGDVPIALRQEMQQGFGVFTAIKEVARAHFDVFRQEKNNPDKKIGYSIGLETESSEFIIARVGFRNDELQDRRIWAVGIGFKGPRLKMDYSFEKTTERTSGVLHSVDMRLPF